MIAATTKRACVKLTDRERRALDRLVQSGKTTRETIRAMQDIYGRSIAVSTVHTYQRKHGVSFRRGGPGGNSGKLVVLHADELQARIAAARFERCGGFTILNATFSGDDLRGRALTHYLTTTLARGRAERLLA